MSVYDFKTTTRLAKMLTSMYGDGDFVSDDRNEVIDEAGKADTRLLVRKNATVKIVSIPDEFRDAMEQRWGENYDIGVCDKSGRILYYLSNGNFNNCFEYLDGDPKTETVNADNLWMFGLDENEVLTAIAKMEDNRQIRSEDK